MSLLFVHNIRMKRDDKGNFYTHSSYNDEVWKRYLSSFKDISIITRNDPHVYKENEAKSKFEKFDSNKINKIVVSDLTSSISSFFNFASRIKIKKTIKEAVLSHDFVIARLPSNYGSIAVHYAKKYNKPYLVELVACPWDEMWNHSIKGKVVAPFNYLKTKRNVRNATNVIYVTNEFLQRRYPTTGNTVNCSNVVLKETNESVFERRMNKINNKDQNDKLIIGTTAAVNVRYKGQQYIIKALGVLKTQGITNIEYQLVGDGDQEYLRTLAQKYNVLNQVKFLGAMPHNKVFQWLDTIDIYVQPSRQEGLPRALIEAMSRGLPCFGANTAGIPELIESNYIFSNTNNNIKEICGIIQEFNVISMREAATKNFYEAKKYEVLKIEERRKAIFKEFAKSPQLINDFS